MRRALLMTLLVLWAGSRSPRAEEDAVAPDPSPERRDAAVKKAFGYLDEHLWRMQDGGSPEKQYAAAVAGWAYLLAGERHGRRLPSRTRQIQRIRDYLERYVSQVERIYEEDGPRRAPTPPPPGLPPGLSLEGLRTAQYTWPLAMAAFFFAESHERGKDRRASKRLLRRVVAVLEAAQQPDGGWGHDDAGIPGFGVPAIPIPKPGGGSETLHYPHTLVAATSCAASAVGAAHRVLATRDPESVARARRYYGAAQNPGGTFPYDPSQRTPEGLGDVPGDVLDRARTGGALFALLCLGGEEEVAAMAARAVDAAPEDLSEGHGSATMVLQLGALASRVRGSRPWAAFRGAHFPRILDGQREDGAFTCVCRGESLGVTCDDEPPGGLDLPGYLDGKGVYVTAIHTLILLLDRAEPRAVPAAPTPEAPVTPR